MRRALVLGLFVVALAAPVRAAAATYCAYTGADTCPPGSAQTSTSLQAMLDQAAGTIERDTVVIRPGSYDAGADAGFSYVSSSPVDIVGSGAVGSSTVTTIGDATSPSGGQWALRVSGNSTSTLTGVAITTPAASSALGLDTEGIVDGISVNSHGSGSAKLGVELDAGGVLRRSTVVSAQDDGIAVAVDGQARIEDSHLVAATTGVNTTSHVDLVLRRTRVDALTTGRFPAGGSFQIDDLVAVAPPDPGPVPNGLIFFAIGAIVDARLDHVTMVGNGVPTSNALVVTSLDAGSTVTVRNSILRGWDRRVQRNGAASHPANVTVSYSDVPTPLESGSGGPGSTTATNNVDVDPLFVAPLQGDFELSAASPLIDAGDPAGLSQNESATDAGGAARIVDGLGICAPRTDMGAYERQPGPRAPHAAATATPPAALSGQAVGFDASASCDPDGDQLTYAWRFDDGATAGGPTASHAFILPGPHHGVVTVTDASGRTATASAEVVVAAPFAGAKVTGGKVKLNKRGRAPVKLTCPKEAAGSCDGTLTLLKGAKTAGSKDFSIPAGRSARVGVKPSVKVRKRGLKVTARAVSHDGSGQSATRTAKLTLRP
jgi:hypothetical protein